MSHSLGIFSPKRCKKDSVKWPQSFGADCGDRGLNPKVWSIFYSSISSLSSPDKPSKKTRPRNLTPIPTQKNIQPIGYCNEFLFEGMANIIEATIRENEQRLGNTLFPLGYKKKIDDFLKWVYKCSHLHLYCFVVAVGYLHRMVWTPAEEYSSMSVRRRRRPKDLLVLTRKNWKLLVATAIMVAQKFSDDVSYLNTDFVKLLGPAYHITQLNKMEVEFLVGLNWNCSFTFQDYHAYYGWISALSKRCV